MNISQILGQLANVRKSGGGWIARCPAHEDRSPSLSIREGNDGRVLLHCFTGCTVGSICSEMGLKVSDLFSEPGRTQPKPREVVCAEKQIADLRSRLTPRERELSITIVETDLADLDAAIARGLVLSIEQEIVQIVMVEERA